MVMLVLLSVYSWWHNRRTRRAVGGPKRGDFRAALRESIWEIPLPIVVLGGIYSGYFAVSEAAAVTALYVLMVEVAILREIPLRRLPAIMRESMVLVGDGRTGTWTRYFGFPGTDQIMARVNELAAARHTAAVKE